MKLNNYIKNEFTNDLNIFFENVSKESVIYKSDVNCILIKDFNINHINLVTYTSLLKFNRNNYQSISQETNEINNLISHKITLKTFFLNKIPYERMRNKKYFALTLYYIILFDQFCFRYIPTNYLAFRLLTNFPKYINPIEIGAFGIYYDKNDNPYEILEFLKISLNKINIKEIKEIFKKDFFLNLNKIDENWREFKKNNTNWDNEIDLGPIFNEFKENFSSLNIEILWKKFETKFMKKIK
tara:strand:+ start:2653 stop:3375 length:723 start_codon:yes stop_codon:yes gene_type:complete